MEYERQDVHKNTKKFTDLCKSIIVGNNITKWYDEKIKMCDETAAKYVKTQWTDTMKDIQVFCNDSVCTHFQDLQSCKSKIYESGIQNGQVKKFCRTFNESMKCANEIFMDSCLFDITFYYSLLSRPSKSYYNRACLSGCSTLDETVQAINTCWGHHYNDSLSNCQKHINFKTCVYEKGKICEEINKLLPPSIHYAEREVMCTTTSSTTTTHIPLTTTQILLPTTQIPLTTTHIPFTTTHIPFTTTHTPLTAMSTTTEIPATTEAMTTTEEKLRLTTDSLSFTSNMKSSKTFTTTRVTQETNIPALTSDDEIRHVIRNCLAHVKDQSSLKALHIDFETCMSVFKAYSCLHSNISIGKNILILNELLPQSIFNFTEDVFEKCHQLINNYYSYIQRVESSCGRPKPKTIGCSGHNYGLLDCDSSAGGMRVTGFVHIVNILTLLYNFM
ncbi:Hypothetical predicted protein [Mytilus galloprovincialis]|uniref:Uncharacterized protein n=1 Tax=Mytilus galloprovincialis TaxID=29158 RepID=A0A8B6G3A1_MYTGA|nr:Hypothetical predicted protein [Mytilus galloprovincialis]